MNEPRDMRLDDLGQRVQAMGDPAPRSAPGPTPVPRPAPSYDNYVPSRPQPPRQEPPNQMPEQESYHAAPPPPQPPQAQQHQLPAHEDSESPRNGLQRAVSAVKAALPFVQKLLPLLDGNVVTAVSSLLAPMMNQPRHAPAPQQVKVDLEPMERGLAELRAGHRELRNQVADQVTAMKRVEDQLERVREATDRNTLEQQEMVEDLRAVGNRVSTLAIVGVVLLAVSLGLNIYLMLQLQHLLH